MSWKSEKGVEEWLSRCAVGVLKTFANISSVSKRLSNRGISFSSSYIGDKSILYCFDLEIDRDSFLSNRFFWDDCFSSFSRWSEILIPKTRLAWIEVSRVPLYCWESSFFIKLGWLIGEPLLIDEDTVLRRRLDRGKMLVLIPHAKLSSWTVNVKMERAVVAVNLVEDKAPVCFKWLNEFFGLVSVDPSRNLNLLPEKEVADLHPNSMGGTVVGEMILESDSGKSDSGKRQHMGERRKKHMGDNIKLQKGNGVVGCVKETENREKSGRCQLGAFNSIDGVVGSSVGKVDKVERNQLMTENIKLNKASGEWGTNGGDIENKEEREEWASVGSCDLDSCDCDSIDGVVGSCVGQGCRRFKIDNYRVAHSDSVESNLANRRSVKVFGSKDGSRGGVSVSGNQVVYINFEEDKDLQGVNFDSPAIDLFVDLGGLEPFVRKGKLGNSMDSSCPSIAKQRNKRFFPSRSHRMKTRSGARGFDFKVIEDVLVNKSDGRKEVVKG
ncbi:hypothetical protein LWI29_026222 [Acer saccharum]|uniref:DUF4283 domain-containing protein n=1 Tax=Acer saccharum TaxID=4024 RepID=A0AA39RE84_ACESA|nr:hypothetical protein LWI29_026222 [Acer saccharum]